MKNSVALRKYTSSNGIRVGSDISMYVFFLNLWFLNTVSRTSWRIIEVTGKLLSFLRQIHKNSYSLQVLLLWLTCIHLL